MIMYEKKIREIIASNLKTTVSVKNYDADGDLRYIGMNSITFISIIVDIEDEFNIEFPEDKLLISEASTISLLKKNVESAMENKNRSIKK